MTGEKKNVILAILMILLFAELGCGPSAFLIQPVPAGRKLKETTIYKDKGFFRADDIDVIKARIRRGE